MFGGFRFRKFLLVAAMIGIEACETLEVIFMIANVQTLGVAVKYSSIPGIVGACCSLMLIPVLGYVSDKWAGTRLAKAKILISTVSLQIIGTVLVFTANSIKLLFYDRGGHLNSTNISIINGVFRQDSLYTTGNSTHVEHQSLTTITSTPAPVEDDGIFFYAVLAMLGYSLTDCGYDASICFLKTFSLSSAPPEEHSSIIVRSIFISSIGGCVIAVLGSVGLGEMLTAGTSHDVNAAQSALLAALCFLLLSAGLTTTLTTGLCCPPTRALADCDTADPSSETETSRIVVSPDHRKFSSSCRYTQNSHVVHITSGRKFSKADGYQCAPHKNFCPSDYTPWARFQQFLHRQKKQIVLNIASFFLFGSLYSYEVYSVNFVGEGILKGDPQADTNSQAYKNYVDGIEIGSSGTLVFFVTFTIFNSCQEILLRKLGWRIEMMVACAGHVTINLLCAMTAQLWAFYLTAIWTGFFRMAVVTLPFVLANQFALDQGGEKNTGVALACVASMLPGGFLVCSALLGPLIDVTGNPATPIYYTAATALLGGVTIFFLK